MALISGYKVSDTVRKGILDVSLYNNTEKELMLGSLAALGKWHHFIQLSTTDVIYIWDVICIKDFIWTSYIIYVRNIICINAFKWIRDVIYVFNDSSVSEAISIFYLDKWCPLRMECHLHKIFNLHLLTECYLDKWCRLHKWCHLSKWPYLVNFG